MEVLVLIPARGGSKNIPHKNIRNLAGYPLIAYSIAAGLAAETVTRVVVSTDDPKIAEIANKYGGETPFIRPAEFAQDETPDLPVFQHAINWLAEHESYQPEIVVQLRPTSPFRRVWHIDQAVYRLIERPDADAIRTVCVPFQNPFKMWNITPDGLMHPLIRKLMDLQFPFEQEEESVIDSPWELYNLPRQVLPDVYWQTGYVDVAWTDTIITKNSMTGDRILPLVIDPSEWVDIDSLEDWHWAERMLESGELTFEELGFLIK
jgi:N-acylneuraminate cytidylyltransferase